MRPAAISLRHELLSRHDVGVSVHAFIDESGRGGRYFICVAIVEPAVLKVARQRLAALLLPGASANCISRPRSHRGAECWPIGSPARTPKTEERDRQRCLARAVGDLLELRADRLVLDSRDLRDAHDRSTIYRTLGHHPARHDLTHEHLDSAKAPLLWIPGAVAWCYGAGGDWRRRIMPVVSKVIEL